MVATHGSPAGRRALGEMPINVFGRSTHAKGSTIEPSISALKHDASLKRGIDQVDRPEEPPASRVRASLGQPRQYLFLQEDPKCNMRDSSSSEMVVSSALPEAEEHDVGHLENDSQSSFKDSMSSLIDFDIEDNTLVSQQTAATEVSQPSPPRATSLAETLRLRLRMAMFKVETNQIGVPLSKLQLSPRINSTSSMNPKSSTASQPKPQGPVPKLLPAPVLRPTAYSSRRFEEPQTLSSPPQSLETSPVKDTSDDVFLTPALPRRRVLNAKVQMSSPPDSVGGRTPLEEDGLTSSIIKGRAAAGLLGLLHARQ